MSLLTNSSYAVDSKLHDWDVNTLDWVKHSASTSSGPSSDVNVLNFPATQPVSGPLTDTQLRASAVPISGALTDTQLRASAVPVSLASAPSTPVTNANLDAALSTLATQATLALVKAKTDNLDVALSTVATQASLATRLSESDFDTKAGALTEAAPASDTASSGLNGRLQRVAQRLTSLIALVPSALVGGRFDVNAGAWLGSTAPTVGQKTMANSVPIVIASDQGAISTQKAPTGGTNVLKTGTITTTATTADQVVLTYTVTAAKTLYLQYVVMYGRLTTLAATATILGAISLETPSGTKVLTFDDVNPTTSELEFNPMPFPEPIPIAAGVVVRIVVTPAAATSMLWRANFGGYEK